MSLVLDTPLLSETATVCRVSDLEPGWGVAALLDWGSVALFRTVTGEVFAVDHRCACCGASVVARGIVGDRLIAGVRVPTVACPLHKHVFRLDTGECLTGAPAALPTVTVSVDGDDITIHRPSSV